MSVEMITATNALIVQRKCVRRKDKLPIHRMILPLIFLGKLFMSTEKRRAMSIERNEEIESLLKLRELKPWAVCYSISGDILVAMRSEDTKHARVVGYQVNVKTREYRPDHKRQALFGSPMFLT